MLVSGVSWSLTYLLILRRGLLDRTYGMPLAALCANLSWELIFAFYIPAHHPAQHWTATAWLGLDLLILGQVLAYWRRELPEVHPGAFYALLALALGTAFGTILGVSVELEDWKGGYAAYGQNLMMSILFVTMLYRRGSLRGQSIYIAGLKLVGTASTSLALYAFSPTPAGGVLMPFLYVAVLVYDLIYLGMIYRQAGYEGVSVWRRL